MPSAGQLKSLHPFFQIVFNHFMYHTPSVKPKSDLQAQTTPAASSNEEEWKVSPVETFMFRRGCSRGCSGSSTCLRSCTAVTVWFGSATKLDRTAGPVPAWPPFRTYACPESGRSLTTWTCSSFSPLVGATEDCMPNKQTQGHHCDEHIHKWFNDYKWFVIYLQFNIQTVL